MHRVARAIGRIFYILCILCVTGCDDLAWNNPYPNQSANANTLYTAFTIQPKTLDPARAYSENELIFVAQIYEPVLEYNYLLRPYKLQPLTATKLITPTYDAKSNISTYRIEIKPGILYQQHPAFAKNYEGKYLYHNLTKQQGASYNTLQDFPQTGTRELKAEDYVYEIKRLADPRINSPVFGFLTPYINGIVELRDVLSSEYKKHPTSSELDLRNYEFSGAKVIDDYTYEVYIKGKYPQFKYWLAMPFFCPMPWEAMRFYAQPGLLEHNISIEWYPVGTGAYYLAENNPDRRMSMKRNPNYHPDYYPNIGEPQDAANGLLASAGERLPFIDTVVFSLERENVPYWDKFLQGYYDRSGISADNFNSAISSAGHNSLELTPELIAKNVRLRVSNTLSVAYWGFNMLDDTVGGYSDTAKKLRHAISLSFDVEEYIVIFTNGRGLVADGPIPPGIFGYEDIPNTATADENLKLAKKLLIEAGYPEGRHKITGAPLQIYFEAVSSGGPDEQSRFAWISKQLDKLGIELIVRATDYNRFMEKMDTGNAQMYMWSWGADYPDPENFLFMFYSKNGKVKFGGENASNYSNPNFDVLYEQFQAMEDTPQRLALITQMLSILRIDVPWVWGYYSQLFVLSNPWAGISKPNAIANNTLKYVKTDPRLRAKLQQEWNQPLLWPIILCVLCVLVLCVPIIVYYKKREHSTGRRKK